MKKLFWIITASLSIKAYSQETHKAIPVTGSTMILFQYDTAGNQIVRSLCINCPPLAVQRNATTIAEEDLPLEKFFPEDVISYYPNPVKEELYLKWDLVNNNSVNSIEVYSLNGQLLKSYKKSGKTNSEKISFQEFASGIYTVLLQYSNGENHSIKIIKQ